MRNELGEPGPDGRREPVPIEGSEFRIEADSIIVAIGQQPDLAFLDGSAVWPAQGRGHRRRSADRGRAGAERVYAGGDVTRGPAIIIQACADGRRAAEAICEQLGIAFRRCRPHRLPELSAGRYPAGQAGAGPPGGPAPSRTMLPVGAASRL